MEILRHASTHTVQQGRDTPSVHDWPNALNAASRCSGGRGWSSKGGLTVETAFEWGMGGGQQAEKKGKGYSRQREQHA